jgi:hypothetical protein
MEDLPLPVLDLSDAGAAFLCPFCGGRFVRQVRSCSTCGNHELISRSQLLSLLEKAGWSGQDEMQIEKLMPLSMVSLEDMSTVHSHLVQSEIPFLLLDSCRAPLKPEKVASAVSLYVLESRYGSIQDQIEDWLVEDDQPSWPEGAEPEQLVQLYTAESEVQAPYIGAILGEASIPFLAKRTTSQMGIRYGALGTTTFFVEDLDQERALEILNNAGLVTDDSTQQTADMQAPEAEDDVPSPLATHGEGGTLPDASCAVETTTDTTPEVDAGQDDLESLRRERRYNVVRLLTFLYSAVLLVLGITLLGSAPIAAVVLLLVATVCIGLAQRSKHSPEEAFGGLFLLYLALGIMAIVGFPHPILVPGVFVTLAAFFAYKTAVKASRSPS